MGPKDNLSEKSRSFAAPAAVTGCNLQVRCQHLQSFVNISGVATDSGIRMPEPLERFPAFAFPGYP